MKVTSEDMKKMFEKDDLKDLQEMYKLIYDDIKYVGKRNCLRCDAEFMSKDVRYNRICPKCSRRKY